jgi:hypothetical protein
MTRLTIVVFPHPEGAESTSNNLLLIAGLSLTFFHEPNGMPLLLIQSKQTLADGFRLDRRQDQVSGIKDKNGPGSSAFSDVN